MKLRKLRSCRSNTLCDLISFQNIESLQANINTQKTNIFKKILMKQCSANSFSRSRSWNDIIDLQNSDPTSGRNGLSNGNGSHVVLAPPMPPIAPAARLRRANSSTLSLTKNKRKMLTVCYTSSLEYNRIVY